MLGEQPIALFVDQDDVVPCFEVAVLVVKVPRVRSAWRVVRLYEQGALDGPRSSLGAFFPSIKLAGDWGITTLPVLYSNEPSTMVWTARCEGRVLAQPPFGFFARERLARNQHRCAASALKRGRHVVDGRKGTQAISGCGWWSFLRHTDNRVWLPLGKNCLPFFHR